MNTACVLIELVRAIPWLGRTARRWRERWWAPAPVTSTFPLGNKVRRVKIAPHRHRAVVVQLPLVVVRSAGKDRTALSALVMAPTISTSIAEQRGRMILRLVVIGQ